MKGRLISVGFVALAVVAVIALALATRPSSGPAASSAPTATPPSTADPIPMAALAARGHEITVLEGDAVPPDIVSEPVAVATTLKDAPAGSQTLKVELASVTNVPGHSTCVCYVIAVNPKGGAYSTGGGLGSTQGMVSFNYDTNFVDAKSGQLVLILKGVDPSLGAFPAIDGVAPPPGGATMSTETSPGVRPS